jgi:hypothetical protein
MGYMQIRAIRIGNARFAWGSGSLLLATALLANLGMAASPGGVARTKPCESSTVDDLGPDITAKARSFLAELKSAVRAGHKQKVASMISYPLSVSRGDEKNRVKSRREFVGGYEQIFTPQVAKAVISQTPDCLFANSDGVMIGDGEVWFQQRSDGRFGVIAVNLGSPK